MGTVGDAYGSAMAEIRCQSGVCVSRSWKTKTEGWYNPRRRHTGLDYQSSNILERKPQQKSTHIENQIAFELQ